MEELKSEQMEKAAQHFALFGDKTKAYRSAYNCEKMKPETVNNNAYKLFKRNDVLARVAELKSKVVEIAEKEFQVDAAYVLKRHTEIDQLDILDIMEEDFSSLKPLSEWPKSWRTSITGVDVSELFEYTDGKKDLSGFIKKIKLPDKLKNLEGLGKHVDVQAYKEKVDHTLPANSIMVIPGCTSVEDWESQAKDQQGSE